MKKPAHHKMTSQAPMYIYATEMVANYYRRLNLKDKRVLSIVGSGDQIIDAYYFGAREVVGFDINRRAYFMLDLKIAALNNLSYQEFIKFFGSNLSNGTFLFSLYNKLRPGLSSKTQKFFDGLYREFKNKGRALIKSDYFRQRSWVNSKVNLINHYLKDEQQYLTCRKIMKNKPRLFFALDVNDILLNKKLSGKFDIINLSNVLNYLTGNIAEEDATKVLALVIKKVSRKLNKGGIFFYYSYTSNLYDLREIPIPPASRLEVIEEIKNLNNFKLTFKRFQGTNNEKLDRINIFSV